MAGNYRDFHAYDQKPRWICYWHQIDEVMRLAPKTVLEIGIGNRLVSDYLGQHGIQVSTLDVDASLAPDIVGSVAAIPLPAQSVDVVLCAEILEHLPFAQFETALRELDRVARSGVVLSLPHAGPYLKFGFKTFFLREGRWMWKLPWPQRHRPDAVIGHEWEIGKRGTGARKIRRILESHFSIVRDYIPFENQYHHFYVLKPRPAPAVHDGSIGR